MKFLRFVVSLFLILGTSIHLVICETSNSEKSDCTKLYNFLKGDSNDYADSCCLDNGIECEGGYITTFINALGNKISNLSSFPYLPRITELQINQNDLKEIPSSILKLTSLKKLGLLINNIEVIPSDIKNLSQLEELCLDENKIKKLPDEIFKLTNLKFLGLSGNRIETIPSSIKNLSNLEELQVFKNSIKKLPDEIFKLKNLKRLVANENSIEKIPSNIKNLSQLEYLYLNNNKIKELPDEIFNLKNLKTLGLGSNKIEEIPTDIKNFSLLEELILNNNEIKELPNEIFNLTNLKTLKINDNPNLSTRMIKFGDLPIEYCDFRNIKISCYEPHTCETIIFNNKAISDVNAQKEYKICSKEETDKNYNSNDKQSNTMFIIELIIVIECIIIIIISSLFILRCIKKRSNIKRQKSYYYLEDDFPIENIENYNQRNSFYSDYERVVNDNDNRSSGSSLNRNRNRNTMIRLNDVIQDIYTDESNTSQTNSFY